VLTDVRKRPAYKRLESARRDVGKRVDEGVENVLGAFGVASRSQVQRLDRKLNQMNKKLRELEQGPA
jgi:polyhydroxyalkanoate synthesis regulator phasin